MIEVREPNPQSPPSLCEARLPGAPHRNEGWSLSDPLAALRHAVVPSDGQREENDDVQRQRGQHPQQVVRVAEEAELAEDVHADEQDRRPPRPACSTEQTKTDTRQDDPPEQHDPAPPGDIDNQEAPLGGDVVVVPQERDQALEKG